MAFEQVSFCFARYPSRLAVRELTGFDEQCIQDVSTATAIRLLDRVAEGAPGESLRAAELPACDRDRMLAAVYRLTYGAQINSTARCTQCGSPFDLVFSLDDLLATVERERSMAAVEALPDGTFRAAGQIHFRLPTGEDELAVAQLPPEQAEQALWERCVKGGLPEENVRAIFEEALEDAAPLLALDIDTACPECGGAQAAHFDIQFYLLRALEQERTQIAREIHQIAGAYGWSLQEILTLRRSDRRLFVQLIEAERARRRRLR
jgi:hypothetical protein